MRPAVATRSHRPRQSAARAPGRRATACLGVAMALVFASTSALPAQAREIPVGTHGPGLSAASTVVPLDAARIEDLVGELEASHLPRAAAEGSEGMLTNFSLGHGVSIAVPSASGERADAAVSASLIGAGWERGPGVYVSFDKTDQEALSAGVGAALGVAICAAGPVACGIATVVIAAAAVYVVKRGLCSGRRELRIYASTLQGRCV